MATKGIATIGGSEHRCNLIRVVASKRDSANRRCSIVYLVLIVSGPYIGKTFEISASHFRILEV